NLSCAISGCCSRSGSSCLNCTSRCSSSFLDSHNTRCAVTTFRLPAVDVAAVLLYFCRIVRCASAPWMRVQNLADSHRRGPIWYSGPDAVLHAVGFARYRSRMRTHCATVRVLDATGAVIGTYEPTDDFRQW